MKTILVVDDEKGVCFSLKAVFHGQYRVLTAADGPSALRLAEEEGPDLAIVDLMMPGMSGLELLPRLKALDPQLTVLVLSAMHEIAHVVQAVQTGAAQYLTKPFDVRELRLAVEMALREREKAAEITALASDVGRWYNVNEIVGESQAWRATIAMVRRAAEAPDTTVMLHGESGTGKELLARLLHGVSRRGRAPLVPIHCAAIPETLLESELFGYEKGSFTGADQRRRGCIETADGGTLFLDEIGEMPPSMQSKVLRFLQDHQFTPVGGRHQRFADVRVIGATNRDLRKGVEEGWFREDLFYRLNVVPIVIPPLRARQGDVPLLVQHFIAHFRRERNVRMNRVSDEAMQLLNRHSWPGNVRELGNLIERILVLYGDDPVLTPVHLPPEVRRLPGAAPGSAAAVAADAADLALPVSLEEQVAALEKRLIQRALEASGGNLSRAAVLLQATRRIVAYKAVQYGLIPAASAS